MASALDKQGSSDNEEDELESLFKTFDHQYRDLQGKFTDMERKLQEFRTDKNSDEDDGPAPKG